MPNTRLFVLLVMCVSSVVVLTAAPHQCGSCPLCDGASLLSRPAGCWTSWSPITHRDKQRLHLCLQHALDHKIVGHVELKRDVLHAVSHKLLHPDVPLVLHFAGDNGVGKTLLAKEISLATSLWRKRGPACGPSGVCDYGDNLLIISGPAYGLLDAATAAQTIKRFVAQHAQRYPTGAVLLDDAPALDPAVFAALAPLLGLAAAFPDYPDASLVGLTVIITSDFGREGRTRGRSIDDLKALINDELQVVYNYTNVKYIKTFPFLPFDSDAARAMIEFAVRDTPCRFAPGRVQSATVTRGAAEAMFETLNAAGDIVNGNGRAVIDEVTKEIDSKIATYFLRYGMDVTVHVTLHEASTGGLALTVQSALDDGAPEVEL